MLNRFSCILIMFCLTVGCSHQTEIYNNVKSTQIDLSPDEKSILLSYYTNDDASIYEISIDGKVSKKLTSALRGYHLNPSYSPQGDKIIFIEFLRDSATSQIFIMDTDGKNLRRLTDRKQYITEAIFSTNGDRVFFCASGYIGSYSPIGVSAPHEIDIYSIDLNGKNLRKQTNFSSYSLSYLNMTNDGTKLVFQLTDKERDGIYMQSILEPSNISQILVKDNPRPDIGKWFYSTPVLSNDNKKMAFTAPYELYVTDLESGKWEKLYRPEPILTNMNSMRFFKKDDRLLFTKDKTTQNESTSGHDCDIIIMDLKTMEIIEIPVNI